MCLVHKVLDQTNRLRNNNPEDTLEVPLSLRDSNHQPHRENSRQVMLHRTPDDNTSPDREPELVPLTFLDNSTQARTCQYTWMTPQ